MALAVLPASAQRPAAVAADASPLTLWYREPAKVWTEALPVGNGSIGAMVFGGVEHERLQLNEHSVWSGHHTEEDSPETRDIIAQMRTLLLDGKFAEANKLGRAWHAPRSPICSWIFATAARPRTTGANSTSIPESPAPNTA